MIKLINRFLGLLWLCLLNRGETLAYCVVSVQGLIGNARYMGVVYDILHGSDTGAAL